MSLGLKKLIKEARDNGFNEQSNQALYNYLGSLGFTGALNDRMYKYLKTFYIQGDLTTFLCRYGKVVPVPDDVVITDSDTFVNETLLTTTFSSPTITTAGGDSSALLIAVNTENAVGADVISAEVGGVQAEEVVSVNSSTSPLIRNTANIFMLRGENIPQSSFSVDVGFSLVPNNNVVITVLQLAGVDQANPIADTFSETVFPSTLELSSDRENSLYLVNANNGTGLASQLNVTGAVTDLVYQLADEDFGVKITSGKGSGVRNVNANIQGDRPLAVGLAIRPRLL